MSKIATIVWSLFFSACIFTNSAHAAVYQLLGTTVWVHGQSGAESTANAIVTNGSTGGLCAYNMMYVSFEDKEQMATILAAKANNLAINVKFESAAPAAVIAGHHAACTCKVVSVWY